MFASHPIRHGLKAGLVIVALLALSIAAQADIKRTVEKTFTVQPRGTLKVQTAGGNVDAAGITISIDQGSLRKSSLAGKVNGGGPQLYLDSSGGDIRIRTN